MGMEMMWGWLPWLRWRIIAGRVGQVEGRGHAGGFGIAGVLEEVLNRAALHAGRGTPGPNGIGVAFEVAIVLGVGVDQHAGGPALLGQVDFDPAKIRAVAGDDDFAVQVDMEVSKFIEVLKPAIVGVNHVSRHVS